MTLRLTLWDQLGEINQDQKTRTFSRHGVEKDVGQPQKKDKSKIKQCRSLIDVARLTCPGNHAPRQYFNRDEDGDRMFQRITVLAEHIYKNDLPSIIAGHRHSGNGLCLLFRYCTGSGIALFSSKHQTNRMPDSPAFHQYKSWTMIKILKMV